ncbi:MAG: glycerate kinase, partial [Planctomycetes bacterium]|nr:glycerate kinase [Planctomycetota bacterium]
AHYAMIEDGDVAVIEMAVASGLCLVPRGCRNVLRATTFGTGELIVDALNSGVRRIIVGLGGSATCDGGIGCAQALGVRFFDADGSFIGAPAVGCDLARVQRIDLSNVHSDLSNCRVTAFCDVTNPLTGPNGAARIFAPQKGASPKDVDKLECGLERLAMVVNRELGIELASMPRAGSAGGLAGGLATFASADLVSGAEAVLDFIDIETSIERADAVICGEGCLDSTTLSGKALSVLARICNRLNTPLYALVGRLDLPSQQWKPLFADVAAIGESGANSSDPSRDLQDLACQYAHRWFASR